MVLAVQDFVQAGKITAEILKSKCTYLVLEWRTCKGQESSAVVAENRNTMSVLLVATPIVSIQAYCIRKTCIFVQSLHTAVEQRKDRHISCR